MKSIIILSLLSLFVIGCATQQSIPKLNELSNSEKDSLEYELVSFDAEFETWFLLNDSKALEKSNSYYMNWNDQYIRAWNYKATVSQHASLFNTTLDIDTGVDFGYEVNKKLYFYFRFVEIELKIPILDYRRRSLP